MGKVSAVCSTIEILWIEDSLSDQRLIKEFFAWGTKRCNVSFMDDGERALSVLFEKNAQPTRLPDLIIVDLNLPRCDGREVIQRLKGSDLTKDIPIVVFTSSTAPEDVARSYRDGASGYFSKPDAIDDYRDTLKIIRDYWVNNVRLPGPRYNSAGQRSVVPPADRPELVSNERLAVPT